MTQKTYKKKSSKRKSEGITIMVVPHSQKHVLRLRINYRLIYFLCMVLGLTGVFSIITLTFASKTTIAKDKEQESYKTWENKIWALNDGIERVYSNLHLLKIYGKKYYVKIWDDDYSKDSREEYFKSFGKNVIHSARELAPTLDFLLEREQAFRNLPLGWPVDTGYITSEFGGRISPFGYSEDFHTGYDFANTIGTPIKATADGTVIFSGGGNSGYGFYVMILHEHGFVTVYGHADSVIAQKDQLVKRGDVIALLGSTGSATGPHVHYEVRLQNPDPDNQYDIFLNPLPFIKGEY